MRFSYCDIYSLSHSYPPELQLSAEAISSVYTNGFNCVKQTLPEYRNGISVWELSVKKGWFVFELVPADLVDKHSKHDDAQRTEYPRCHRDAHHCLRWLLILRRCTNIRTTNWPEQKHTANRSLRWSLYQYHFILCVFYYYALCIYSVHVLLQNTCGCCGGIRVRLRTGLVVCVREGYMQIFFYYYFKYKYSVKLVCTE